MNIKVVSGGQTGVDWAAILAAHEVGFVTGGLMPKGFKTLDGPRLEAAKYGLTEDTSEAYPQRTFSNARNSDATLRLAFNFLSPGEKCTLRAIKQYNKPYLDVNLLAPPQPQRVAAWIQAQQTKVLNVAGNSEKTAPGIQELAVRYLTAVFRIIRG